MKLLRVRAFVMPVIIGFLAIFSIIAFFLVSHFSGVGVFEFNRSKLKDKQYSSCMAAIRRTDFELRHGTPHLWTENDSQTVTMNVDGSSVTVTREDIVAP